jgi:hypothetical protein
MNKMACLLVVAASSAGVASAQSWGSDFQRHHFTAGLGVAVPGSDLKPYYKNAFAWSLAYGYRPLKYAQIDVGYDGAYNSAQVDDYLNNPSFGAVRIRDFQTFIPLGGRVVLPMARGRAEVFGGGGALYARYAEMLRQPSEYLNLACPVCQARDGWGYYAMLGGNVAIDRGNHIRLGLTVKVNRVETSGAPIGNLPSYRTTDRWVNSYLTLGFSF